jgi:hypothetical protein
VEDYSMKKFVVVAAIIAFGSSAFAAGIDSRTYSCSALHALIAARGFVFIGAPFQGFAVANANSCSGSERLESRSVVASDTPECVVPYCEARPGQEGS